MKSGSGWERSGSRDDGRRDSRRSRSRSRGRRSRSRSRSRSRDASKRRRYDDDRRPSRDLDGNWKDQQTMHQGDDGGRVTSGRPSHTSSDGYAEQPRHIEPTSSLMLKGLPFALTNAELASILAPFGPQFVRIITNKVTGESRGFAFVDFSSVESAQYVVQHYAKEPLIIFGRGVAIGYSETPKTKSFAPPLRCDWLCEMCHVSNFAKRVACFKCGYPKSEHSIDVPQGGFEAHSGPSHILVVRALPPTATETELAHLFANAMGLKEVRLVRDRITNVSRGFGFAEFDSVELATSALAALGPDVFFLGTTLRVAFAQESGHMAPRAFGMSGGNVQALVAAAMEQAQWSMCTQYTSQVASALDVDALVDSAAAAVQTPATPRKTWPLSFEEAGGSFVFVAESGLYYDADSMFYYDPSTKTYYNSYTGVYYMYDVSMFRVFEPPAPTDDAPVPTSASASTKKKTKGKAALNISFGIKASASKPLGAPVALPPQPMPASTLHTGTVKKKHADEIAKWSHQQSIDVATAPVADVVTTPLEPSAPAVCLLCRRKFNSHAQLQKHEQFSDLHKQNVLKAKQAAVPVRERVVERGEPISTPATVVTEVSHVDKPLDEASNIGGKMLKMMGWNAGEGLGKLGTGITAPIAAVGKITGDTSGLGGTSLASNPSVLAASTQREKISHLTRARFERLDKQS